MLKRINQGDKEAVEEILNANRPIIISIIKNYFYVCLSEFDKEDLYQAGSLGLLKAVEKYNPKYKNKFMTYAYYLIKGEVQTVHQSLKKRNKYITYNRIRSNGLSIENPDENIDIIGRESFEMFYSKDYENVNNKILVDGLLDKLSPEHKLIIEYRYFEELSQKEVGEKIGKNQVYVSREEKKARELIFKMIENKDCTY